MFPKYRKNVLVLFKHLKTIAKFPGLQFKNKLPVIISHAVAAESELVGFT